MRRRGGGGGTHCRSPFIICVLQQRVTGHSTRFQPPCPTSPTPLSFSLSSHLLHLLRFCLLLRRHVKQDLGGGCCDLTFCAFTACFAASSSASASAGGGCKNVQRRVRGKGGVRGCIRGWAGCNWHRIPILEYESQLRNAIGQSGWVVACERISGPAPHTGQLRRRGAGTEAGVGTGKEAGRQRGRATRVTPAVRIPSARILI